MWKFYKYLSLVLATIVLHARVCAQTTVTVGGGTGVTCPATPTATWTTPPPGISFSNWARGSGVSCSSAGNALSGSSFIDATADNAVTANHYYTVTISADATHTFTLNNVTWITQLSNTTNSCKFTVEYSNNGGAITTFGTTGQAITASGAQTTFAFNGTVNVAAGTSLILYLIPYQATTASTTVRWINGSSINVTAVTNGNSVSTGTITGSPFCVGSTNTASINVPFTATGTYTSNTYTAQLSDATGSFNSPANIGTLVSDANSGTINATIPAGTAAGSGYRVRVVASSPATTGTNNGTDLAIVTAAGNNVTSPTAASGNTTATISWTNPANCFSDMMIVASTSAFSSAVPSGNSYTYSSNSFTDASNGSFDGGKIIYKGTTSPQTITNLVNGTVYNFKIFVRYLNDWSSGATVSVTPAYQSQSTDYFRSNSNNTGNGGKWSIVSNWESSPNGVNWYTATLSPTSTANTITIRKSHYIQVNNSTTADQLVIESGSVLSVPSGGTLTLNDGAGVDLSVDGTFSVGAGSLVQNGQMAVNATGTYQHLTNGGTIPTATWSPTSICSITGITTNAPSGLAQAFGNLSWNCSSQTAYVNINSNSFSVAGTLSIISTGTSDVALVGSTTTSYTNTIKDLSITGGTLYLNFYTSGTGGTATLNVNGNITFNNSTSAKLLFVGGDGNSPSVAYVATLNLKGDLTVPNSASFTLDNLQPNPYGLINFVGTTTQNLNMSAGSSTTRGFVDFYIKQGAYVQLLKDLVLQDPDEFHVFGTIFTQGFVVKGVTGATTTIGEVHSGATFITGLNAGLDTAGVFTGALQTNTRDYASDASYEFRGTTTGTFSLKTKPSAGRVKDLTINSAGTSLSENIYVSNNLVLQNGVLTIPSSNTLTIGGTVSATDGTITCSATSAAVELANTGFTLNAALFTTPGSVSNLTNNSPGRNYLNGDFTVGRTLTLTSGILDNGNNSLTLQTSGSGSPIVRTNGTLAMGTGSSLTFGSANNGATIPDNTFTTNPVITNFVVGRGANSVTLGNQGMEVTNSVTLSSGTLKIGSSHLNLNGASLSYASGVLDGSSSSVLTVTGTTGGTVNLPTSGNIALNNFTISGTRTVVMNGTDNISLFGNMTIATGAVYDNGGETAITQGSGSTPTISISGKFITRDAQGFSGTGTSISANVTPTVISGCTVEYGLAGDQTVNYRTDYKNLIFSNSGTKTLTSGFNPAGNVLIKDAAIVDASNYTFGDAGTSLTMTGGRLKVGGTGTKPDMTGAYSLTGGTIEFANTAATQEDIRLTPNTGSVTYYNMEVSGTSVGISTTSGSIKLAAGGTFKVLNNAIFKVQNVNGFSGATNTAISSTNAPMIVLDPSSTIEYNGALAQTLTPFTYENLTISGAGTKTITSGDITVDKVLRFTTVPIVTNSYKVIITGSGSVTGASQTTGWVAGYLRKRISATGSVAFEIGGNANYRPINMNIHSVTNVGSLIAFVKQSDGVYTPLTGSGLDNTKTLLRHFNLGGNYTGNVTAEFSFIDNDVPSGAAPASFVVRTTPNSGSTWNGTTIGNRTANSTGATFDFVAGDYVIGNSTVLTVTQNPSDQNSCAAFSFSASASSAPSATASPIAVRWQENSGSGWADVAAGGIYTVTNSGSNPLSSTLSISSAHRTMSGYTYRAVFTDFSGDAMSTVATLTVVPNTWTATANNIWSNAANWSCSQVPGPDDNAVIPTIGTLPQLTGSAAVYDLTIQSNAFVALSAHTLTVNGNLSGSGTITGSASGNLVLNGTGTLNLTPNYPNNLLQNLTINSTGSVTLGSNVFVAGLFTPTAGTIDLNNNVVTLMAGTGGEALFPNTTRYPFTATIGQAGANILYGSTGGFVLERYIPELRRYRMLSPAVSAAGTIRDNWQEGGSYPEGYGTHITGAGGTANGFDQTATNNPSLFTFDNVGQTWNPVSNTNTTQVLQPGTAWRLLVRGDRKVDLYDPSNHPPETPTIVRTKGQIKTGDVKFAADGSGTAGTPLLSSAPNKFSLIGNPYYAAVSFDQLFDAGSLHNLAASYTTIDPTLSNGTTGVYVTYNAVSHTTNVFNSEVSSDIQPGQAFFVQNDGNGVSPYLTFKEDYKTAAFTRVFRSPDGRPKLKLQLLMPTDTSAIIFDGAVAVFDEDFSSSIGREDSYKLANTLENLAIVRNGYSLSIEGRPLVSDNDTVQLKTWNYKQKNYLLQVAAENFGSETAYLHDRYLQQQIALPLSDTTIVPFSITTDSASFAPNRFFIVFKPSSVLAASGIALKGFEKNSGVQLEFTMAGLPSVEKIELERSLGTGQFAKIGDIKATSATAYTWFDADCLPGFYFYRIKLTEANGNVVYSNVATVKLQKVTGSVSLLTNPVRQMLNLKLKQLEPGAYNISIFNRAGQKVLSRSVRHNTPSANHAISLPALHPGLYFVEVAGTSFSKTLPVMVE